MEIGICLGPKEAAGLPGNAFDFLEVNVQGFLVPEKGEADFLPHLDEGRRAIKPIKTANCFLPGDLKCFGPDVDETRLMRYAETAFRRAEQAGVEIIVFGSGTARRAPEGYPLPQAMEDFVRLLRRFGPIAQRHGVTLVIEPLNTAETNFITSLAEGAEAVERCDHPNVQMLADSYHMQMDGEPFSEIARFGRLLRHIHVAELSGRGFPGKSRENFHPLFQALEQAGYKGRVALECVWDHIETDIEPGARFLREAME